MTESNHVFSGAPDARQSADQDMPTSRFRPRYRALNEDEFALHDTIKAKAAELEALFEQVPMPRQPSSTTYPAYAMHYLELAVMLSIKALTS